MFVEFGASVKKRSSAGGGEEKTPTEIPGGTDPTKVEVIGRSFVIEDGRIAEWRRVGLGPGRPTAPSTVS